MLGWGLGVAVALGPTGACPAEDCCESEEPASDPEDSAGPGTDDADWDGDSLQEALLVSLVVELGLLDSELDGELLPLALVRTVEVSLGVTEALRLSLTEAEREGDPDAVGVSEEDGVAVTVGEEEAVSLLVVLALEPTLRDPVGVTVVEEDRDWELLALAVTLLDPVGDGEAVRVLEVVLEAVVDTVRVAEVVGVVDVVEDRDTDREAVLLAVTLAEALRELVGDGDGLQPATVGAVRVTARCCVPTMSCTMPMAVFTTVPQLAKGEKPLHADGTQALTRQFMWVDDMDAVL